MPTFGAGRATLPIAAKGGGGPHLHAIPPARACSCSLGLRSRGCRARELAGTGWRGRADLDGSKRGRLERTFFELIFESIIDQTSIISSLQLANLSLPDSTCQREPGMTGQATGG